MTIFLEDSFDSAHSLPHLPEGHKCRNLHGHTYRVRIEVSGPIDPQMEWVMDYSELKGAWAPIKATLDHKNIDDVLGVSTCENLTKHIWLSLKFVLPKTVELSRLEVRETERCGCVMECS